jgi:hypothetical protein
VSLDQLAHDLAVGLAPRLDGAEGGVHVTQVEPGLLPERVAQRALVRARPLADERAVDVEEQQQRG